MLSTVTPIYPYFMLIASSITLIVRKIHVILCYFISHIHPYATSSLLSELGGYGLIYGYCPKEMVICQVIILLIYVGCRD